MYYGYLAAAVMYNINVNRMAHLGINFSHGEGIIYLTNKFKRLLVFLMLVGCIYC